MLRSRWCLCVWCLIAAAVFAALVATPEIGRAAEPVSFIRDIAPMFKENCQACHDSKKKSGKLDMTTYARLRQGGVNEDPILPGKPEESHLMEVLTAEGAKLMPPKDKGGPLAPAQIKLVERWIAEGAKLDAGLAADADLNRILRQRWQPPEPPGAYPFPAVVTALAFTPDSKRLVAGGHHELTIWDAASGALVGRLRTRAERAYAMQFLPDGTLAVAGGRPGQEGDVSVYDLAGGVAITEGKIEQRSGLDLSAGSALLGRWLECDDSMLALALSPNGKRLAAAGCDRTVRVWAIDGGRTPPKLEQQYDAHADWVLSLSFSRDGQYLLSGSRDKTAKSFDLAKKEAASTFADHQAPVYGVVSRPDGKSAASVGGDKQLRFWPMAQSGKQIKAFPGHSDEVLKLLAHPSQPLLLTSSADKTVRIWKDDGVAVRTLTGLPDVVYALAISPDGNTVAAGGYGGAVRVWSLADGKDVKGFNASPGLVSK